jgi:hypothetical protein
MENVLELKKVLQDEKFSDLIISGFTIKELYNRFEDQSISFRDFSKRFFNELSGSFIYDSKKKKWELASEDILIQNSESKNKIDIPKFADQLLEFHRLSIETCLNNYLNGMYQEEFRRLVTPLIKENVKDEFSSKVIPAVINNLREYVSKLISEVETNQENLIRSLLHEKLHEYDGRIKKLEKKVIIL